VKATIENIRIAEQDRSYNSYVLKQSIFDDYWHYHPEIEITYIVKGEGIAFIGNKTVEFRPGKRSSSVLIYRIILSVPMKKRYKWKRNAGDSSSHKSGSTASRKVPLFSACFAP
jgi:hypothetical protein